MVEKEYFGEGKNIEFKREIPQNHEKILKDIIAFSNTSGGKVIIGIEDETNIVYGIGDQNPFKLSDSISTMISDACTPQIDPDITMRTLEGKTVLEVEVVAGKFRPYYIASKGKETTSYIRINGTSRPADTRRLKELEMEGQNLSYDKMLCIGKEYDEAKALHLCKEMQRIALEACKSEDEKAEVKDMTLEKLEDFGVLSKTGKKFSVTNAFDLMTDNKNRNAKVQCALFKGTTRDIFIDQKEFTGPIYEQVDDAYHFILRHINMGTGIPRLYNRSAEYGLPEPLFEEFGDGIKVTMFRKVSDSKEKLAIEPQTLAIDDEKLAIQNQKLAIEVLNLAIGQKNYNDPTRNNIILIYENVDTNEIFGSSDVAKILECSLPNARLIISKLRDMKMICEVKGHGKGKYRFLNQNEV